MNDIHSLMNVDTAIIGSIGEMVIRFAYNLLVVFCLSRFLYFRKSRRRDFFFTFMLMSSAIFFLMYFMTGLEKAKATMGVGLGLFGILSIMRYRTDVMPVREMTYLFVIICLSVAHSMGDNFLEFIVVDAIVALTIWFCERDKTTIAQKLIMYDDISKIMPDKRSELIDDLSARTGLKVVDVEIGHIDFLRDMAMIRMSYVSDVTGSDIENRTKLPREF